MLLQEKISIVFFIMNEVGIFLDLKNELENEINFWKEKFRKTFGYQLFIDHPPHITLHNFFTDNLDQILSELIHDKLDNLYPLKSHILKTSYFPEDSKTHTTNLHYLVHKDNKLSDLQRNIVNKLAPFVNSKFSNKFDNEELNTNNRIYKYPYVGDMWIPHISICSLDKLKFENEVINEFINFVPDHEIEINKISIYTIHESNHTIVKEINL